MTSAVSMLMTVADLYALPDDGRRHELVHGRLVSEPPPTPRHGRIAARLVQRIDRPLLLPAQPDNAGAADSDSTESS